MFGDPLQVSETYRLEVSHVKGVVDVPIGVEALVANLELLDYGWVLQRSASL
jgi:hypothetical protein